MKIKKLRKSEVAKIERDFASDSLLMTVEFKTIRYEYNLPFKDLKIEEMNAITRFEDGTHHLFILTNSNSYVGLETTKRIARAGKAIDKFDYKEYDPIDYINYFQYDIFTQIDGITTIVGMSGAGKTYSALNMMEHFADYFDKIAYLNYELPDRDVILRLKEMYKSKKIQEKILDKMYIKEGVMTNLELEEILEAMDVMANEKVVFIIDNVGSVIGQEDNVWKKQNEFLKQVDTICKDRGFHALALTQTVKDNHMTIFDENGEVLPTITMSIMSGSIMLGNFSRTVLFTGYNSQLEEFKVKVLKKGSGKSYSEEGVNPHEWWIKL